VASSRTCRGECRDRVRKESSREFRQIGGSRNSCEDSPPLFEARGIVASPCE